MCMCMCICNYVMNICRYYVSESAYIQYTEPVRMKVPFNPKITNLEKHISINITNFIYCDIKKINKRTTETTYRYETTKPLTTFIVV